METSYGITAVIAAAALIGGLVSLLVPGRGIARMLSLAGIASAALALSLSGHAATAPPRLLTAPAVFVHVLCVAFWVGALAPLVGAVRDGDGAALARFSRIIPYPLAALAVTGIALAFVQLDRVDALWTTNYGLVLSGKLALVLALLALAAANRFRLAPRFEAAGAIASRPLTMSIKAEWALAVLILALVAVWRFTPPPRALAAAEPASIHFHGQRAMAQIDVVPVRARGARVTIDVLDGEFRPLDVKDVTLAFSNRSAGIEPLRRAATRGNDGLWRINGIHIPIGGRWRLRVEILVSDFDKVVLEDDVELPRAP
jgi:copper transport protein